MLIFQSSHASFCACKTLNYQGVGVLLYLVSSLLVTQLVSTNYQGVGYGRLVSLFVVSRFSAMLRLPLPSFNWTVLSNSSSGKNQRKSGKYLTLPNNLLSLVRLMSRDSFIFLGCNYYMDYRFFEGLENIYLYQILLNGIFLIPTLKKYF